jgi:hypothetical protein
MQQIQSKPVTTSSLNYHLNEIVCKNFAINKDVVFTKNLPLQINIYTENATIILTYYWNTDIYTETVTGEALHDNVMEAIHTILKEELKKHSYWNV